MDAFPSLAPRNRIVSAQRSARATFFRFVAGAACCLLVGCAAKKPPQAQDRCPPNRPGCQIEVVFTDVGLGERVARLEGSLSADQPSVSYAFTAAAGDTLRLKLAGPAAYLVLTRPNGQSNGPGLPAEMWLGAKGKYVLNVAARNLAADGYGRFQLEVRLIGKP
jgi:hypothetical protein